MTPEERNLIDGLFERLAAVEAGQRDPDAERAIADGLRRAPHAVYTLVQTVLVQDEALKQADGRIRELEAELESPAEPPRRGGFLDNMRDSLLGRQEQPRPRGSVPSVRSDAAPMGAPPGYQGGPGSQGNPGYQGGPGYQTDAPMTAGPPPSRGGSFLGTAAAAAAGVVGGSLLLDSIRSMTGHKGGAFGAVDPAAAGTGGGSPWAGGSAAGGSLSRDAGLDDVGRSGGAGAGENRQGAFNTSNATDNDHDDDDQADDDDDNDADYDDNDDDDDADYDDDDGGDDGDDGQNI